MDKLTAKKNCGTSPMPSARTLRTPKSSGRGLRTGRDMRLSLSPPPSSLLPPKTASATRVMDPAENAPRVARIFTCASTGNRCILMIWRPCLADSNITQRKPRCVLQKTPPRPSRSRCWSGRGGGAERAGLRVSLGTRLALGVPMEATGPRPGQRRGSDEAVLPA